MPSHDDGIAFGQLGPLLGCQGTSEELHSTIAAHTCGPPRGRPRPSAARSWWPWTALSCRMQLLPRLGRCAGPRCF
ncbi:MAG: hypothetical protein WC483_06605 [Candidatus Paceibacterota bacterium]